MRTQVRCLRGRSPRLIRSSTCLTVCRDTSRLTSSCDNVELEAVGAIHQADIDRAFQIAVDDFVGDGDGGLLRRPARPLKHAPASRRIR